MVEFCKNQFQLGFEQCNGQYLFKHVPDWSTVGENKTFMHGWARVPPFKELVGM